MSTSTWDGVRKYAVSLVLSDALGCVWYWPSVQQWTGAFNLVHVATKSTLYMKLISVCFYLLADFVEGFSF